MPTGSAPWAMLSFLAVVARYGAHMSFHIRLKSLPKSRRR